MSTNNPRKLSSNAVPNPARRLASDSNSNRSSPPASVPTNSGQGLARNPSIRQGRALRKPTNRASSSFTASDLDSEQDEDAKAINAQIIADLKEQVQRAEQASEQYRKQLEVMQKRLDDAATDQTVGEERDFQRQTELDHLRAEIKDANRQRRELELSHESDKRLLLQDRERQAHKEADLQAVINRLNETLRTKGLERANNARTSGIFDSQSQVPNHNTDVSSSTLNNGLANDNVHLLQEKDDALDTLRFELAEAQLKLAEQEHMGDGRLQILEKSILETKMQNARLLEENESFQMLLSEKTLKGDFMQDHQIPGESFGMSTLAEELESATDEPETQTETGRKLEGEIKNLRESNKALTLYIDKIIGRLLQHEGYEHLITDKDAPPDPPVKSPPPEKALPAIPNAPPQQQPPSGITTPPAPNSTMAAAASGLLQRARSVVSRPAGKARPMSYATPATSFVPSPATANENPETAPSIPLNRGHRRARSDQAQTDLGAAAVVQQMNRGSPLRAVSGGPLSPGISPIISPQLTQGRTNYFAPMSGAASSQASTAGRPGSGSGNNAGGENHSSSANSITSEHSLERKSVDLGSAPRGPGAAIPGAVMKQNQLRPLRLVQQQTMEDDEAQKKANRGSWMNWLKGSSVEANND